MRLPDVLSHRALNRATLARQLLLERSPMPALAAIEHLVGMQAQSPFAPYFGLWSRLRDFRAEELGALLVERRAVRVPVMRGTVHLVSARDCRGLRSLTQPIFERDLRVNVAHAKALRGLDHVALQKAATELLDEEPLGTAELGAALHKRWPKRPAASLVHAARGLLCLVQPPPRAVWGQGGATKLIAADAWLGKRANRALTVEKLVWRYLGAFGPASVRDLQTWSGLTGLRQVFERLNRKLRRFRSEAGTEIYDLPDAPRPDAGTPAPVRLVAPFDNLLLAHADRARFMDLATRKRFFGVANGNLPGALLVDGVVAGTWSYAKGRVKTLSYRGLSDAERRELETEVERLEELATSR